MSSVYLFQSERLGFRKWKASDFEEFRKMNADPDVMEYFPHPLSEEEAQQFFQRLQDHYKENGYCYFPVDLLETGEYIGFIGLAYQIYESEFTPATDIGWRLKQAAWNNGYATEGARRCLQYAFEELGLKKIYSVCTVNNLPSENVMRKIGMTKQGYFKHPRLSEYAHLENCVYYRLTHEEYIQNQETQP